jgi:hypothetical protein
MSEFHGMCISTLSTPALVELGTGYRTEDLAEAVAQLPEFKNNIRAPEQTDMAALGSHLLYESAGLLLQRGLLLPALELLQKVATVERRSESGPGLVRGQAAAAAAALGRCSGQPRSCSRHSPATMGPLPPPRPRCRRACSFNLHHSKRLQRPPQRAWRRLGLAHAQATQRQRPWFACSAVATCCCCFPAITGPGGLQQRKQHQHQQQNQQH